MVSCVRAKRLGFLPHSPLPRRLLVSSYFGRASTNTLRSSAVAERMVSLARVWANGCIQPAVWRPTPSHVDDRHRFAVGANHKLTPTVSVDEGLTGVLRRYMPCLSILLEPVAFCRL